MNLYPWNHYAEPAPKPEEKTYQLVFCWKCGCSYLDSCREHGVQYVEKKK